MFASARRNVMTSPDLPKGEEGLADRETAGEADRERRSMGLPTTHRDEDLEGVLSLKR